MLRPLIIFLRRGHSRPLFVYFRLFRTVQLLKNLQASRIWTRIVGAVGENTDHYTTTMVQSVYSDVEADLTRG